MSDHKSFDDKQVALILRRATELQTRGPDTTGKVGGLSLADLEEIAVEAGIDPRNIRRAVEELEGGDLAASDWSFLLGHPLTIRAERHVDGEAPDSVFDDVLVEIQNAGLGHGQPSVVGSTLTWRAGGMQNTSSLQVTVSARDGRTEIRAEERRHHAAGGLFGGVVGGGGVGFGVGMGLPIGIEVLSSPLFTVLFPVAIVGVAYGVARSIFRGTGRRKRAKLQRLVDKIAELAQKEIASRGLEAPGEEPEALPAP